MVPMAEQNCKYGPIKITKVVPISEKEYKNGPKLIKLLKLYPTLNKKNS